MSKNNKNKNTSKSKKTDEVIEEENLNNIEIEENEQIPSNQFEEEVEDLMPWEELDSKTGETELQANSNLEKPQESKESIELALKQKVKAVKRSIENRNSSLILKKQNCETWLKQAEERDLKAKAEYDKRKAEIELMMKKTEERFQKRINRTQKWWREYTENYKVNQVMKIEKDLELLNSELAKLESKLSTES